jgi:hypothetical protein
MRWGVEGQTKTIVGQNPCGFDIMGVRVATPNLFGVVLLATDLPVCPLTSDTNNAILIGTHNRGADEDVCRPRNSVEEEVL